MGASLSASREREKILITLHRLLVFYLIEGILHRYSNWIIENILYARSGSIAIWKILNSEIQIEWNGRIRLFAQIHLVGGSPCTRNCFFDTRQHDPMARAAALGVSGKPDVLSRQNLKLGFFLILSPACIWRSLDLSARDALPVTWEWWRSGGSCAHPWLLGKARGSVGTRFWDKHQNASPVWF